MAQLFTIDDTLLLINLQSSDNNHIPAHTSEGQPILRVGSRAVSQGHNMLIFEEGIEWVGLHEAPIIQLPTTVQHFEANCRNLILKRRFSQIQWQSVCMKATPLADGRLLYTGNVALLNVETPSVGEQNRSTWIPQGIHELIYSEGGRKTYQQNMSCLGVNRRRDAVSPVRAILDVIRSGNKVEIESRAEATADAELRNGKKTVILAPTNKLCMITLDIPLQEPDTTNLTVDVHFDFAYWYFVSAVPVIWNNKQYYIGTMNQLLPDKSRYPAHYVREEIAVFTREGLVSNRQITEEVYEKYLLMSFV